MVPVHNVVAVREILEIGVFQKDCPVEAWVPADISVEVKDVVCVLGNRIVDDCIRAPDPCDDFRVWI